MRLNVCGFKFLSFPSRRGLFDMMERELVRECANESRFLSCFIANSAVATATPIPNGSLNQHSETRPVYPTPVRPGGGGYPTASASALGGLGGRAHVTVDISTPPSDTAYSTQSSYDSRSSLIHPPAASMLMHPAAGGSSSGQPSPLANNGAAASSADAKRHTQLGHPLKSFTVPAPPPQTAPPVKIVSPSTNGVHRQPAVNNPTAPTSPFKKALTATSEAAVPPISSPPVAHKSHNININSRVSAVPGSELRPPEKIHGNNSYSTEELNQEMANLEGLMKDLNAITANEFGC